MTTTAPHRPNGARPQQLLRSLLGDFWYWREEHIPSAALVELLAEFDITAAGARTAMRRLAARGLLTVRRDGRTTAYGIPPRTAAVIVEHTHRMLTFGSSPPEWDGAWTVVAFSVPEEERGLRTALRTRLRVLGFAPLYDGVWVSPHELTDAAAAALRELGVSAATVLRCTEPRHRTGRHPADAFDLRELAQEYRGFVERYEPVLRRATAGRIDPAEALRIRTELGAQWRDFQRLDPDLPAELLPRDFQRDKAQRVFVEIYERLGPVAELRFRQVLARRAPELAELTTRHDLASVTKLLHSLGDRAHGDTPFEQATAAWRLAEAKREHW
ncbi:phenylacetic acid-responsive transcriptional repressor [Saccharomonospora marina XMU15]|uniref:Phenylacetic acid-responsive transcriptional repressor n=1 Tax=Saccharomonospora marina XMU15 TaxID=882083 RepID=H5WZQ3_9PSEU|nr:PaaX family transcriptional regulator C-terminal domain-containing protein [Saccharomonospora marina]EHR50785.1 phenylacetic acid-responsive transcriptional repressor [Saccharomonospora marina XMU15]